MLGYFCKIISLKNLHSNLQGQMATLLMLVMVAVLIFILVTVNLGQISLTTTNLSNAADSASLYLASQLATKSNQLWIALGRNTEKCKKGGFLALFLAIIFAIIIVVLIIVCPPVGAVFGSATLGMTGAAIVGGAVAGAVGGAIGGAIAGTGALQGAIQGAMVGAAIGAGATAGAEFLAGGELWTTSGLSGFIVSSGEAFLGMVPTSTVVAGAIAGGVLATGSSIYNAVVADQMTSAAFAAAAKALSGLPEYDRYREGVFLQAFTQTIDDPNKIIDIYDSDGDGDTEEKVPYFQYWWEGRIKRLKGIVPQLKSLTEAFVNGPLIDFQNQAEIRYTESCSQVCDGEGGCVEVCTPGDLSRNEVEGGDGAVVELVRALENSGYDLSFYQPGTPPPYDPYCDKCSPDQYYDEVDTVINELKNFVDIANGLKEQDIYQLTATYQSWIKWFYDPDSQDDYYDTLSTMIYGDAEFRGLNAWKNEIESKRRQLPQCTYVTLDEGGRDYVINPPCQDYQFGTIDADLDNEFSLAISRIDALINAIEDFRSAAKKFYEHMQATYAQMGTDGINPVTYKWKDSRGDHSITAEVGPFKIAWIRKKKSGGFLKKKICLKLTDYHDDNGTNTWVKITRQDPANKSAGVLGKWNPFISGEITKTSKAYYSYDKVGIAGK